MDVRCPKTMVFENQSIVKVLFLIRSKIDIWWQSHNSSGHFCFGVYFTAPDSSNFI